MLGLKCERSQILFSQHNDDEEEEEVVIFSFEVAYESSLHNNHESIFSGL